MLATPHASSKPPCATPGGGAGRDSVPADSAGGRGGKEAEASEDGESPPPSARARASELGLC
ncbi:hypothetical protein T484DRAFT_1770028 [Baffinella frigidus]|nr:hypothetical protein T484DRAFT_1770028 [Cryptophyta sp. CCMP2293]